MIVVKRKDLDEIRGMLEAHDRVLVVGCNTCATVCLAGGEKEVEELASILRLTTEGKEIRTAVVKRQCEREFLDEIERERGEALLLLSCGAGVALASEHLRGAVYPGIDTMFIGAAQGIAEWREECVACGECVMGLTGGVCPVARCPKGLMNGPCGGVNHWKCEVDSEKDCAWVLIHSRMDELGRSAEAGEIRSPKDHGKRFGPRIVDLNPAGGEEE